VAFSPGSGKAQADRFLKAKYPVLSCEQILDGLFANYACGKDKDSPENLSKVGARVA